MRHPAPVLRLRLPRPQALLRMSVCLAPYRSSSLYVLCDNSKAIMWSQRLGCKQRPCLASLRARRYTYRPVRRHLQALSTAVGPHKENAVKFHAFMYVTIGRRRELEQGMAGKNPVLYQRMLDEIGEYARACDATGWSGIGIPEHHLQIEGFELGPGPGLVAMVLGQHGALPRL